MEYTASTEPTPYPTTPKNDEYKKQQHRIKEEHLCLMWRLMHQIELVDTDGPLSNDTYTPGPLATDKHTFKLLSNKHTFELLSQDTYTLTPSPKDKYAPEPTLIFIETSEIHPLELSTTILNGILCITTLGLSFLKSYGLIDIFASNLDCQPNSTYDPTIEPTTETQSNQIKKRIIILALRLNPITYGLLGVNGSHISNPTPTPADTSLTTSNPTSDPAHPSHTATPNDV